ncbi:MAG TPA: choice-of-anchor Q domain-containing protein [Acidimicrobiales bacterium]|jgi:hypothetical protein
MASTAINIAHPRTSTRHLLRRRLAASVVSMAVIAAFSVAAQLGLGASAAVAATSTAWASPAGTSSEPCTQTAPCDLDSAVADVNNAGGGTVELFGDSSTPYTGVGVDFSVPTATVEAAPGAAPVLQGNGSTTVIDYQDSITVSGLDIFGGDNGLQADGCTSACTATVIDSSVHDNSGYGIDANTVDVEDSTIAYNGEGGILTSGTATSEIVTSTVYQNTGDGVQAGSLQVLSSTLARNSRDNLDASSVTLAGSIVADPEAELLSGAEANCASSVDDLGGNISDDTSCGLTSPSSVPDSATIYGSLENLAANGGPTPTVALSAGSPAIGQVLGSLSVDGTALCSQADQRGDARPSAVCDAGAYDTGTGKFRQAINFTSTPPTNPIAVDTYTVTAIGGASGNPVTFSIDSSSAPGACSIDTTTDVVSFTGPGTCVIDANQAGTAVYLDAPQVHQSAQVPQSTFWASPAGTSSDPCTQTAPCDLHTAVIEINDIGGGTINLFGDSTTPYTGVAVSFSVPTVTVEAAPGATPALQGNGSTDVIDYQDSITVEGLDISDGDNGLRADGCTSGTSGTSGCTATVVDSYVHDNGGYGIDANTVDVKDSTIAYNGEGGIETSGAATSEIVSSTVYQNAGDGVDAGSLQVLSSTMARNSGYNLDATSASVAGSILADSGIQESCTTPVDDLGGNISDDTTCGLTSPSSAPDSATVYGSLENLAFNGGPTPTVALSAGSPAIGQVPGSLSVDGTVLCSQPDQRGDARPSAVCDAGAYDTGTGLLSQTISFTSTPPANPIVGDTYTVTATGGASGNPVTFSIDSSSAPGACSIDTTTDVVSFTGPGTCVIDANQAGTAGYAAGFQVQQVLSLRVFQVIRFTSTPPTSPTVGDTYTVTATGGASGNPVTFSIDSSSAPGACSIDTTTDVVSFTGRGTCIVDANQAGNALYLAGFQVQEVSIGFGAQTITFTSSPPNSATPGESYVPAATSSSGLPVVLSIDQASTSACDLSGSVVYFLAGGPCVVDANQFGDTNYSPAPQVQQTVNITAPTVAQSPLTVTSTSGAFGTLLYLTTTGGSDDGAVSYVAADGSASGCAVVGTDALSASSPGTCTVTATMAGDGSYLPVSSAPATVTLAASAPSAPQGWTSAQQEAVAGLDGPAGVAVNAARDLYVADYTANQVLEITPSGTQTPIGSGWLHPIGVAVDRAGDVYVTDSGNHRVEEVTTSGAQATIGSGFFDPDGVAVDGAGNVYVADYDLQGITEITPTGAQFMVGSGFVHPQGVAVDTLGDVYVSDLSTGAVSMITPAGAQSVLGAGFDQPQALAVDLAGDVYVASTTAVDEITPSGTASLASGFTDLASVAIDGTGDVYVSDFTNDDLVEWSDAPGAATGSSPGTATVAWKPPLFDGGEAVSDYTVTAVDTTAAANGGQTCTYTVSSPETDACTVTGLTGGDSYTFTVTATNGVGTSPSSNPSNSVPLPRAPQTVTFTSAAPTAATVGGASYTVTASGGPSGNPTTFTLDSTSTGCALKGSTVTFPAAGTCVIDATQAGDANFDAAPQVQQSVTVGKGAQTVTFTSAAPVAATVGGASYTVTASGGPSGNPVTFTLDSTSTGCALNGSTVTFPAAGTCVIDANQAGDANYLAGAQAQQSFTVVAHTLASTTTSLSSSSLVAVFGLEWLNVFRVSVSSPTKGTPTGTVVLRAGTTTLCTITLVHGSGSCSPGATALFVGLDKVVATYSGDANFAGSTSAASWLIVL